MPLSFESSATAGLPVRDDSRTVPKLGEPFAGIGIGGTDLVQVDDPRGAVSRGGLQRERTRRCMRLRICMMLCRP